MLLKQVLRTRLYIPLVEELGLQSSFELYLRYRGWAVVRRSKQMNPWHVLISNCTWAYNARERFLSKAAFERKLSDVAYTLAHVFSCENQLSEIESFLSHTVSLVWLSSQKCVTLLSRVSWP